MKAVQFSAIDQVKLIETAEPEISNAKDVKIKVINSGICSSDLAGLHGTNRLRKPPLISGHEAAGIVWEIGADVTSVKVGDRVTIEPHYGCGHCVSCKAGKYNTCPDKKLLGTNYWQGTFAEYVVVPETTVIPIPDEVSFEIAAMLEPFAVGIHGVRISAIGPGKTVAIIGAGPMGLFSLAAAKMQGAEKVIVLATREYQIEVAKKLGADAIVNVHERNAVEAVLEETDGVGADVVIMAGGHSDTVDQSVQMAARNGQLIQVTHFRHGCPEFDITTFLWKQLNLQGSYMYTREDYEIAIEAIVSKKVDISPLISKILPIDRAPELFEMAQDRTNPCIKLMIAF